MKRKRGFTLVELVVVVMILGVLAAVAAPKFLNTSARATDNGIRQTLAVVRNAIELYAAENAGSLPATTDATQAGFLADLDPYLRGTFPRCPVGAKNANIKISTDAAGPVADASPSEGWQYNNQTGDFIVNSTDTLASDNAITYNQL